MNYLESKYWPDFLHWIKERESILHKKEVLKQPPPWTDDPIMASVRFCNVRREDDKVTRWIKENWRDPVAKVGMPADAIFAMCIARIINWPDTLARIRLPTEDPWSVQKDFVEVLDWMQARGMQIWGNAYMVTGGYSKGGETKQTIMGRVLESAHIVINNNVIPYTTLDEVHHTVMGAPGLGSFLAAQVVADIKYTPYFLDAEDWWSFCAPGPGSTLGLNYLHDRQPGKGIGHTQFMKEVNVLRYTLKGEYGIHLTAHDVQNCLCEFSKYVRIKYFGGRAKRGYRPSEARALSTP